MIWVYLQYEGVLLDKDIWKQKSFLTIDNVANDPDSLGQGKLYLEAPFVEGSCVIITSRFKQSLRHLQVDETACFEIPELDKDDAKRMFLYHAPIAKEFEQWDDLEAIEKCIESCYVSKGDGQRSHYHPLSLKALGVFLQHRGKESSVWRKDLEKVKELSYSQEPKNPLFVNLRRNFDIVDEWWQGLFMDVALFYPRSYCSLDLMEWLCLGHENEEKTRIEEGVCSQSPSLVMTCSSMNIKIIRTQLLLIYFQDLNISFNWFVLIGNIILALQLLHD